MIITHNITIIGTPSNPTFWSWMNIQKKYWYVYVPPGREVHVTIVTHSSTHSHKNNPSFIHSIPFSTHTVIISPEVLVVGVWRFEKRLVATQHCQWFKILVNQPHILPCTSNLCIIDFYISTLSIQSFSFTLYTQKHTFLF
jgi:hypothetical protein